MQIQIDQARLLSELQTLATFTDAEPADEWHCSHPHRLLSPTTSARAPG